MSGGAGFFWGFVTAMVVVFGFNNDEPQVKEVRVIPENKLVVTDISKDWCQGPAGSTVVGRVVEHVQVEN